MNGSLCADLLFPISGRPLRDAELTFSGGVITSIRPASAGPERKFSCVAVLPAFVNTHTHLELSGMRGLIPSPTSTGEDFTGWVRRVLRIREGWSADDLRDSVLSGIQQLIESGVGTVGDISTSGGSFGPLERSGLRGVVFREALGFGTEREREAQKTWEAWLAEWDSDGSRLRRGLSPHAPYSTSESLYRLAAKLSEQTGCLLATHLSETLEERELIRDGRGPFWQLLVDRRMPLDGWKPPVKSTVAYMADCGVLGCRGLAVHLNYLDEGDEELLRQGRMTPVFCPRSHSYFGHQNHPAARLMSRGLPITLGTDSLASNAGLDMLGEIREAVRQFPEMPISAWFNAATLQGAVALGLAQQVGSLESGKQADLVVLELPSSAADDETDEQLYTRLLDPAVRVTATYVDGVDLLSHPSARGLQECSVQRAPTER